MPYSIHDSEERLLLALAAGKQGLFDLNIETGAVLVSTEYATMLGHDPQSFQETQAAWRERLHPEDRDVVADTLKAYLGGHLPAYRLEYRLRTREGGWKWILSLGEIEERSADGRPLRMLGTHTDIDALKAAESALREINATLEARVAERTAELTAANRELETFQRLHRQDEFPGIGIGLATVQRIVLRHGCGIAVHAVPGGGASFCIALPQVPGRAEQVAKPRM